jgi:hypothetical protein
LNKPHYSEYNLDELYDAYNHIDKERYPDRVQMIEIEINKRRNQTQAPVKLTAAEDAANNNSILSNSVISSGMTFFYKFLFPIIWILGFGAGTILTFLNKETAEVKWEFLFAWLCGSFFILWFSKDLKTVRVDIDSRILDVSNFFRHISIPFSSVDSIKDNKFINPETISIFLKIDTQFGQKIKFIPSLSRRFFKFAFFKDHPVVSELKELIKGKP